jgi:hypothetical protein
VTVEQHDETTWPVVTYRARLRDTIQAVVATVPAVVLWAGAVWVLTEDGPSTASIAAGFALAWTVVAALLWSNRRQRVVLAADGLVVQRRLRRRHVAYRDIAELSVDVARGVVLVLEGGSRVMLPWPPMRTPSGGGLARAREVHDELARRVAASGSDPASDAG